MTFPGPKPSLDACPPRFIRSLQPRKVLLTFPSKPSLDRTSPASIDHHLPPVLYDLPVPLRASALSPTNPSIEKLLLSRCSPISSPRWSSWNLLRTNSTFKCDWQSCGNSFNRRFDLRRNYRIHTGEYGKGALMVHTLNRPMEELHQCQHPESGKSFSAKGTKQHLLRYRNRDKETPEAEVKFYHQPQLRGLKNWEVPGTINGVPVNAFPDTASCIDVISEDFAKSHELDTEDAEKILIQLPGGNTAESHGCVTGRFQFQGENRVYERSFRVLRKSVCDVVLGLSFLQMTKTLSDDAHRIIASIRPYIQKGSRLFLLDESPQDHIRCTVNGVETAAFPDTGSDLIPVSGDFARRNKFKVRREAKYRRQVELINGSLVWTDGMILDAELTFDHASVPSARELDYYQYLEHSRDIAALMGDDKRIRGSKGKTTFIFDLHVIEDLPCPLILSGEFIFQNQVFSRFKHLFVSEVPLSPANYPHPTVGKRRTSLDEFLLFIRLKKGGSSWLPRLRRLSMPAEPSQVLDGSNDQAKIALQPISNPREPTWQQLWDMEEERRNQITTMDFVAGGAE